MVSKTSRIVKKRIKNIFSSFEETGKDVDYLYLAKPDHDKSFSYFSGVDTKNIFYSSLLISRNSVHMIIPQIEKNNIHETAETIFGDTLSDKMFDFKYFSRSEEKVDILKKLVSKDAKIGLNFRTFNYSSGRKFEEIFGKKNIIDVSEELYAARASKDETEIENIQKACNIVSKVSREIPSLVKKGITEKQLARDIDDLGFKKGSVTPSFPTLVGFGRNSALAHPPVGSRKLKKGDFILLDFGATHSSGYNSDISRTFVFGKSSFMQRKMYEGVYNAKAYVENALSRGISLMELQDNTSILLEKFPGELTHSIGHSLGLEVHDGWAFGQPQMVPDNYVTTIEPGLYNKELGGVRIEDDYVLDKKKLVKLTRKALPTEDLLEL